MFFKVIKRLFSNDKNVYKNIPKCTDCKNFIKHIENGIKYDELGKCRINGYSFYNEKPVYFYANSCRMEYNEKYCGPNGIFFKK